MIGPKNNHSTPVNRLFEIIFLLTIIVLSGSVATVMAQNETTETRVVVRAIAHDAKFIGTSMGGIEVTIKKAGTGDVLAQGMIEGGTGDTDRLVRSDWKRYEQLSTPGAAHFETTLGLSEPVFVTVEASGPKGYPESAVTVSRQLWLLPGKHMDDDGIVLTFPGFVIDFQNDQTEFQLSDGSADGISIPITAKVVMMCGCPTSPDGLWDSNPMEISAEIIRDGSVVDRFPLEFAGTMSTFSGLFKATEKGTYTIRITAFDDRTSNTGVARKNITVQ